MKANQQTVQQIERVLRKVISRYPEGEESVLTDLHVQVRADSGEIRIYDDDDNELTRCVVEEWIDGDSQDDFYTGVAPVLRQSIEKLRPEVEKMAIMKPFSFVLIDDDKETLEDLFYVDDEEIVMLDDELLKGLDEDLDAFFHNLMDEN